MEWRTHEKKSLLSNTEPYFVNGIKACEESQRNEHLKLLCGFAEPMLTIENAFPPFKLNTFRKFTTSRSQNGDEVDKRLSQNVHVVLFHYT